MATVSVKLTPKLLATRVNTLGTGVSGGNIDVALATGTGDVINLVCTKLWVRSFTLAISTAQTLDLTALASGEGDTAIAAVKLVDIRNNEAVGSGKVLQVGNDGTSAEFISPFGAAGDIIKIQPGCSLQLYTRETAGWVVSSTNKLIKLTPGAATLSVTVTVAGI